LPVGKNRIAIDVGCLASVIDALIDRATSVVITITVLKTLTSVVEDTSSTGLIAIIVLTIRQACWCCTERNLEAVSTRVNISLRRSESLTRLVDLDARTSNSSRVVAILHKTLVCWCRTTLSALLDCLRTIHWITIVSKTGGVCWDCVESFEASSCCVTTPTVTNVVWIAIGAV
jgi:hypothetical protein